MSARFAKTLAFCAAALAFLALSLAGLRAYLGRPLPCEPPCRRLVPAGRDDTGVFLPQIQPLEVSLELKTPVAKAKTRFTLHYRVLLRNMSDADFSVIDSSLVGFQGLGFFLRVWDPAGRELHPLLPPGEADGVIPYDVETVPEEHRYVEFKPGETLAPPPSVLRPFRYTVRFYETRTPEGLGTAIVKGKVRAEAPGWPAPAPGFRVLDSYEFETPGRYRIQAVFNQIGTAYSVFPAWSALPDKLRALLFLLKKLDLDLTPPYFYERFKLHAESPILEFEVK